MAGEQGVLELRHDGLLVAEHAVEQRLAGGDLGDGVAPDLLLDRDGLPAGGPELAQGGHRRRRGAGRDGHGSTIPPHARDGDPRGATPHDSPIGARWDCTLARRWTSRARGGPRSPTTTCAAAALGLDYDDDGWEPVPGPGPLALHAGVRRQRRPAALPRPLRARRRPGGARHWVVLDGVFYQADVWLDGAYLGDPEGYFFPHTFEITGPGPPRARARAGRRGGLRPAARPHGQAQPSPASSSTGTAWTRPGTRAACGAAVRIERTRAGAHRPHARAVPRRRRRAGPRAWCAPSSTATRPARSGSARRSTAAVERELEQSLAARAPTRSSGRFGIDDPRLWWPWSLGDQPLSDRRRSSVASTTRSSDARTVRTGLRAGGAAATGCSRQRRAPVPQGRQPGPDPHGPRRGHARRSCAATSCWPRTPGSTSCGSTATSPGRSSTTPPTSSACSSGRTSRCSGATPASVRKQAARQAAEAVDLLGHHPSIAIWCGHNEPLAARRAPGEPVDGQARRRPSTSPASSCRRWNQIDPRPLGEAGLRAGRRHPPGHRPLRRRCPTCPQLDGTDSHLYFGWYHGDERDLPGFAAAMPRMVRFVSEFGAQAVPADADVHGARALARPRLGAAAASATACRRPSSTSGCPPADHATFDAWREATQRYQAALLRHHIETLRRLKYRPDRRASPQFSLADAIPAVTWSRARSRPRGRSWLPRRRRRRAAR